MIFVFAYREKKKNRRKIISSHQQGSWARGYNNLLFSRINGPNVYPCVRPHSLQARGYRESSRASFAPRASSSRGSLHSSLALVVTNPWIAEHHIVWCSITSYRHATQSSTFPQPLETNKVNRFLVIHLIYNDHYGHR